MKQFILIIVMVLGFNSYAQTNQELLKHYEAYYKQMKSQADIQGIINGLTHLNVLSPSTARQDTLAYIYMNEGKFVQAINTVGVEVNSSDSNIAVEVKAVSLKGLSQPKLAIPQFEELFKRTQNVTLSYELAELYLQTQNIAEASKNVEYGILHAEDNMKKTYYESQQPYQVPLKAAFLYLKGLIVFNENKETNIDIAVSYLEQALTMAPNFNLAYVSRTALLGQKPQPKTKE
ncbi:tetratricopeptide repeat protein [Formosa maritima]|uniref:Tetratricopeptide repeat protein n=1 Tax=Formosa maritima TaxID=2592046 RepID=A0A5D0G213_9FLAO|nr:hypothetical protein [Formosa maritima]TYA52359.1 hypothetical protein FVF61_13535 [Formosa maritima]